MIAERLESLRLRIDEACDRCGRDPAHIELLPVSKRQPLDAIREAASLGLRNFGENYVQEGAAKHQALPDLRFHLIGPLQRNKAKSALEHFQEILTVDRPELAARLRHLAEELHVERGIWVQLDLWNESTKQGGCSEAVIPALLKELDGCAAIHFRGFMAIPPLGHKEAFTELATARDRWQQKLARPLRLSMGMSGDLESAIEAGSDQIRIGTALFGERH